MGLDLALLFALNSLVGRSHLLDAAILFFASTLAYVLSALFIVLLWFWTCSRREKFERALVAALSVLFARDGVTELIRYVIHRPRPFVDQPVHALFTDPSWSFPSGHATFFFALSTAVYLYDKRWGSVFFIFASFITVARVVAGVHYPSDILAGAIIGASVGYVSFYGVRHFRKSRVNTAY